MKKWEYMALRQAENFPTMSHYQLPPVLCTLKRLRVETEIGVPQSEFWMMLRSLAIETALHATSPVWKNYSQDGMGS